MRPGLGIRDSGFAKAAVDDGGRGARTCTRLLEQPRGHAPANPESRIPNPGFSLLELLVALAVFAALAAAAYGGLAAIARTRGALAAQQDRFAALTRSVSTFERDLRQALSRPVLGNTGNAPLPALAGSADAVELTRLGYANPLAEPRSHLERVAYAYADRELRRARWAVLDRAPDSAPTTTTLLDGVDGLRLRYLDATGWRERWPPQDALRDDPAAAVLSLPRAVEFRLALGDLGEVRRVVELPSPLPPCAGGVAATAAECAP